MGIGDWGLGITKSPIPNPQSPKDTKFTINYIVVVIILIIKFYFINNYKTLFKTY